MRTHPQSGSSEERMHPQSGSIRIAVANEESTTYCTYHIKIRLAVIMLQHSTIFARMQLGPPLLQVAEMRLVQVAEMRVYIQVAEPAMSRELYRS